MKQLIYTLIAICLGFQASLWPGNAVSTGLAVCLWLFNRSVARRVLQTSTQIRAETRLRNEN